MRFASGLHRVALGLVLAAGLAGCTSDGQRKAEDARRETERALPGGSDQPDVEPRPSLPNPSPPADPEPLTIDSFDP